MAIQITRGLVKEPERVVIFGQEKVGKSTLASQFPAPLFIDTEQSTGKLDVYRTPAPSSWPHLFQILADLKKNPPKDRKTLVIDTIDWAQRLCATHVIATNPKKDGTSVDSIEGFGFGRGYTFIAEEFGRLLDALKDLQQATGWHVVLVAHGAIRKFELPEEEGSYDRWEMKIERRPQGSISAQSLVKEWATMILFASYKTIVVENDNGKRKASGEKRVLRTSHTAVWDAGNRHGLKPEIPMEWASLAHLFSDGAAPVSEPQPAARPATVAPTTKTETPDTVDRPDLKELQDLMEADGITEADIQAVMFARKQRPKDTPLENLEPEFVRGWIMAYWPKVVETAKELKNGSK